MTESRLPTDLLVWLGAALVLGVGRSWRRTPGCGLVLAYLLNLWILHWVAPAMYLLPDYRNFDPEVVELGLKQSTYAILAFALGSLVLTPFLLNFGILPRSQTRKDPDPRLPVAYLAFGAGAYALLSMGLGALPSATAIFATGQQLVVAGLALCCWRAWSERSKGKLAFWLSVTLLLPLLTVITRGFIGYGALAALTVVIFISGFSRRRVLVIAAGLLLGYVGLSVFVTYMRDREEIRATVWGGQSIDARMAQLGKTATGFEWFDVSDSRHLQAVDGRLNQSYLTGLAVRHLSETGEYADGATLWYALLALIPRAIWPEKTIDAGSGSIVSQYTGITFGRDTSVGTGQVMEFYINFGEMGVIVGFMIMGVIVTAVDIAAAERLALNDWHAFVLWYVPGISLLQVGGSLIEVNVSTAASVVTVVLVNGFLDRLRRKDHSVEAGPPAPLAAGE